MRCPRVSACGCTFSRAARAPASPCPESTREDRTGPACTATAATGATAGTGPTAPTPAPTTRPRAPTRTPAPCRARGPTTAAPTRCRGWTSCRSDSTRRRGWRHPTARPRPAAPRPTSTASPQVTATTTQALLCHHCTAIAPPLYHYYATAVLPRVPPCASSNQPHPAAPTSTRPALHCPQPRPFPSCPPRVPWHPGRTRTPRGPAPASPGSTPPR